MTAKKFVFADEARQKILKGVSTLAAAVKVTLGPGGKTVVITKQHGTPHTTKDGVTVAKEVELEDDFENMGAQMVKQVASKTADMAGDGTTTATILAEAIYKEGMKLVAAGVSPVLIKQSIELVAHDLVEILKEMAKPIANEQIAQVARISANNDEEIGNMIAKAIETVGKHGSITVEEGSGFETTLHVVEGMHFDKGFVSPHFINQPEQTCVFEKCHLLLVNSKITNLRELASVFEPILQKQEPVLVIADDFDNQVLGLFVLNKVRMGMKICAVKAPAFGERRKAMLEDIAIATGATVISDELGLKQTDARIEHLGFAQRVIVNKNDTTLMQGSGNKEKIQERMQAINALIAQSESEYEKEKLAERIAALAGGIAIIKVGGATEIEMRERKDRVDDAQQATKAAIEEGILPGGGIALIKALNTYAKRNTSLNYSNKQKNERGLQVLNKALLQPFKQICVNADLNFEEVYAKIKEYDEPQYGYDATTGNVCNMYEKGIIDPAKVTRAALQNAVSIATLMLTTDCIIAEIPSVNKNNEQERM